MSRTTELVRRLCSVLYDTLVRTPDWRFANWLQTPLPLNEYWDLVRTPQPAVPGPVTAPDAKRRRTATFASADVGAKGAPVAGAVPNRVPTVVNVGTDTRTALVSVTGALADEQALLLRSLEDTSRKHFDYTRPGVTPKLTQLLLVVALEPCSLALEFVLHKRFDGEFVARNFLAQSPAALAVDDAGAWARDVKRASFNLFDRFPELAVQCTPETDLAQLRALQHLWCLTDQLFLRCNTTLHSERASDFSYNGLLDQILTDRAPLLIALASANIYAAGTDPGRFTLRRDLFVSACVAAQLHVVHLHAHAQPESPAAQRLSQALGALKAMRVSITALQPNARTQAPAGLITENL